MRWRSAKELKWKEVPVIIMPGLTEAQEKEIAIKDNGDFGEWDFDVLANSWGDLPLDDWGVNLPEDWAAPIEPKEPADAEPQINQATELNKEWGVKTSDLWLIGEHRLLCGNSTKTEDAARLMGGQNADMVFTDPPYGVSYIGINNPNGRKWDKLENDDLKGDELQLFLKEAFRNMHLYSKDDIALYCWHASSTQIQFEKALNLSGFEVKQQLIWNKGMVLGHSDYHWAHEPLFYCRKIGQKTKWYGTRTGKTILGQRRTDLQKLKKEMLLQIIMNMLDESTTWEIDRDSVKTYQHSTQKPVRLAIRAFINSSIEGDIIMDSFLGSGTTMVAAQNLGRKCYGIEISPDYCAVILQRMKDAFPEIEIKRAKT
jgi:DNA modification methylase